MGGGTFSPIQHRGSEHPHPTSPIKGEELIRWMEWSERSVRGTLLHLLLIPPLRRPQMIDAQLRQHPIVVRLQHVDHHGVILSNSASPVVLARTGRLSRI